jgi:tocopherol cyclase
MSVYRPEVFQGNLKKKNYFEGWYFKHVSQDLDHVWSFIPGVSLNESNPHSFIQVINGITGESEYISYPVEKFKWDSQRLFVKVGDSVFTDHYIDLKIESEFINITGHIDNLNIKRYPKSLLSPGIMGWYSFIPFMECKHGIVSVNHDLVGNITINNEKVDFDEGKGYIEKDWGASFPEAWIWIQANNFNNSNTSFTFSVAKIPWLGKYFIGFISFLCYDNKFFLFSTYNNSAITEIKQTGDLLSIKLQNKDNILNISALKNSFGELRAPVSGDMSRRIKESIDSEVTITLLDKDNNFIYSDSSRRAGLEIIDKIFEYL